MPKWIRWTLAGCALAGAVLLYRPTLARGIEGTARVIFVDVSKSPRPKFKTCDRPDKVIAYRPGDHVWLVSDNGAGGPDQVMKRYSVVSIMWPMVETDNPRCWSYHSRAVLVVYIRPE